MLLTKEAILAADDRKTEVVPVPEWGGEVTIMTMSAEGRDVFEGLINSADGKRNLNNFRAKLVAATAVDEKGALMFTENEVRALGRKSAAAMDRLADAATRLNQLSQADVEALTKN